MERHTIFDLEPIVMSSADKPLGGRVAIVGTGSRAAMFVRGIIARPNSQVVAICEPNAVRAEYYNALLTELGAPTVPVYKPDAFQEMLAKEKVETIVVTCVDALHDLYIVPALEAGGECCTESLLASCSKHSEVRVLTEKPMTTDVEKCRRILDMVKQTGNHVTVTFNYRLVTVESVLSSAHLKFHVGTTLYMNL